MRFLSSDGWKAKSKPARVLIADSLAIWTAILTRRFSRRVLLGERRRWPQPHRSRPPRSMPRRVTSRTSSARGIFKATRLVLTRSMREGALAGRPR